MTIAIGSDHGGFNLKKHILDYLTENGHEYKDFGVYGQEPADYSDIAKEVCAAVNAGQCERGILICGTGIGMSIAANKIKGIRAAHVTDTFSARMAMEHNDAQVLCLGERILGSEVALEIVKVYLQSSHLGGRHAKRVQKIMDLEF